MNKFGRGRGGIGILIMVAVFFSGLFTIGSFVFYGDELLIYSLFFGAVLMLIRDGNLIISRKKGEYFELVNGLIQGIIYAAVGNGLFYIIIFGLLSVS